MASRTERNKPSRELPTTPEITGTAGAHRTPARIHRVRAGQVSRGVTPPVPRVYLSVSLTRPDPSGSPEPTRLCRGCSTYPGDPRIGCRQLHPTATTAEHRRSLTSIRHNSASWRTLLYLIFSQVLWRHPPLRDSSIPIGGPDVSIGEAHRPRASSAPGLGRGRGGLFDGGGGEVGGRGRSPEDVALGHRAAETFEFGELGDPFDALGDHGQGHVTREAEQVAQEHRMSGVESIRSTNERSIFTESSSMSCRRLSEECPTPKSSSEIPIRRAAAPVRCRRRSSFRRADRTR